MKPDAKNSWLSIVKRAVQSVFISSDLPVISKIISLVNIFRGNCLFFSFSEKSREG